MEALGDAKIPNLFTTNVIYYNQGWVICIWATWLHQWCATCVWEKVMFTGRTVSMIEGKDRDKNKETYIRIT